MQQQDSSFNEAEQQTYRPRSVNVDPSEQQRQTQPPIQEEHAGGYTEGYTAQEPYMGPGMMGGEKISPARRRKRRAPWILLAIIPLVFMLALGGFIYGTVSRVHFLTKTAVHTFTVNGRPALVVRNDSGKVFIHTGSSGTVIVQEKKYAEGIDSTLDNMNVTYYQEEPTNKIGVIGNEERGFFFGSHGIDLDITVPNASDVEVQTGAGSVTIDGVNGQASVQTGSGSITANSLNGQETLKTGSGGIQINDLKGQATMGTGSGSIYMRQAQLSGQSIVKTGSGSIAFAGTLDPHGRYHFETGSGSVNLALPASSAFHLTTSTGSGSTSNDFGSTSVGNGQQADVTINTGSGSIYIRKE